VRVSVFLTLAVLSACSPGSSALPVGQARSALWEQETARLQGARAAHSATLLLDGRVLFAGGNPPAFDGCELYDPASGRLIPAAKLSGGREQHAAILLPDGRVLVAGGVLNNAALASTELYDPATDRWSAGPPLTTARRWANALRLRDGSALVLGGDDPAVGYHASAERFDPLANSWSAAPGLGTPRTEASAALLSTGEVLVTGGRNAAGVLASSERWNPEVTGAGFAPTGALGQARLLPGLVALRDGRVLAAGGDSTTFDTLASSELYDPASGGWQPGGNMLRGRRSALVSLLPDGSVLFAGGGFLDRALNTFIYIQDSERFDPATGIFSATPPLRQARLLSTLTPLPNGRLLVAGGFGPSDRLEQYDPTTPRWSPGPPLPAGRLEATLTELGDGRLLLAGGRTGDAPHATTLVYSAALKQWSAGPALTMPRTEAQAALLADGRVLICGGRDGAGKLTATCERVDVATASVVRAPPLAAAMAPGPLVLLPDGRVLRAGGDTGVAISAPTGSAEVYRPATGDWSALPAMKRRRMDHTLTLLPDGKVIAVGGYSGESLLAEAELLDPSAGSWTLTASLATARRRHAATALPDGRLLVTGGYSPPSRLTQVELFDPVSARWTEGPPLPGGREQHTAVLLHSGRVLVTEGVGNSGRTDRALWGPDRTYWTSFTLDSPARRGSLAALLPDGELLVVGGEVIAGDARSVEIFSELGSMPWRPRLEPIAELLVPSARATLGGRDLAGASEGSSGYWESSATNHPVLIARRLGTPLTRVLPVKRFSATRVELELPAELPVGLWAVRAAVSGVSSEEQLARVPGPSSPAPADKELQPEQRTASPGEEPTLGDGYRVGFACSQSSGPIGTVFWLASITALWRSGRATLTRRVVASR
jgi:hypothetical protein